MKQPRIIARTLSVMAIAACVAMPAVARDGGIRSLDGTDGPVYSELRAGYGDLSLAFARLAPSMIHNLGPLTEADKARLHGPEMKASTGERIKVGIVRSIAVPPGFDPSRRKMSSQPGEIGGGLMERAGAGNLVWTSGFTSEGAGAIRLQLENIRLPLGTVGYVYNDTGEVQGPYSLGGARAPVHWTHTIFSQTAFLEIQFPNGEIDLSNASMLVSAVGHLENEWFAPENGATTSPELLPACFEDAACIDGGEFSGIDDASRAVAHIVFRDGGGIFICSGGLLNSTFGNSVPYFLTANHCVSSQESATSLEAYWDYKAESCGASAPGRSQFERSLGATLLATGSVDEGKGDFTFLQLTSQPPSGRFYLGWTAEDISSDGTKLIHRIAHPGGEPQSFSRHVVSEVPTPGACSELPQGPFIYSKNQRGSTKGGSSGSPAFLEDGLKVVGQLFGKCGQEIADTCDAENNSAVDGAFAAYFDSVKQWLAPETEGTCTVDTNTLCLLEGRFKVVLTARDPRTGATDRGTAIPQNNFFGYFSLPGLTNQADNPEVFVKVLDGTAVNGRFWVFYGGLTDLELEITVTDTEGTLTKVYNKNGGSFCGDADTSAF